MENSKEIIDGLSHVILGIVFLATTIVRLTPTKSDDVKLDQILKKLHMFMGFFPTLGKNPMTKELEKKSIDAK